MNCFSMSSKRRSEKKSVQMPKWQYFLLFVLFNDDGPRWLVLVVVVVWFRAMDDRLNNNKKKYLADDWLSREHKFTSECVCRNWMSLFSFCVCVCVIGGTICHRPINKRPISSQLSMVNMGFCRVAQSLKRFRIFARLISSYSVVHRWRALFLRLSTGSTGSVEPMTQQQTKAEEMLRVVKDRLIAAWFGYRVFMLLILSTDKGRQMFTLL